MAKPGDPLVRFPVAQACLSAAVGLVFGSVVVAADVAGIRTLLMAGHPGDMVIFLASAVTTFFPFVMATAVGLLASPRRD